MYRVHHHTSPALFCKNMLTDPFFFFPEHVERAAENANGENTGETADEGYGAVRLSASGGLPPPGRKGPTLLAVTTKFHAREWREPRHRYLNTRAKVRHPESRSTAKTLIPGGGFLQENAH